MTSALLSLLSLAAIAHAQVYTISYNGNSNYVYTVTQDTGADVPLASKVFPYPELPYKADTGNGPRGTMQGYNLCNSSTAGQESLCSTAFLNSADDFCLWGAPEPNSIVGNIEGEMVAYCTSDKYGTRVIPAGALQGVQFTQTPGYVQVVGYIDQTLLGLQADDYGGEEDNKGADQRGNPLGSLVYSSAWGAGPKSNYIQSKDWSMFIGSGVFCFKVCDPSGPNSARLCEHVYDRIGCAYNAPADYAAINGTFQSCKGNNQLPVGVYVEGGQTKTWYQPPESDGPINTIPYTPMTPASSECSTFSSAQLFSSLTTLAPASSSVASSAPAGSSIATVSGTTQQNQAADESSDASRVGIFALSGFVLALVSAISLLA